MPFRRAEEMDGNLRLKSRGEITDFSAGKIGGEISLTGGSVSIDEMSQMGGSIDVSVVHMGNSEQG
jgi:hypothetical protein